MPRRAKASVLLALSAAACLPSGEAAPPPPSEPGGTPVVPTGIVKVARVTGGTPPGETLPNPNATDARYAVWGTDLGILWDAGGGECLVAFGDTYGKGWGGSGGGPRENSDWRSNVLGMTRDKNPADGLILDAMVTDRPGHAKELLPGKKVWEDEETVIPTTGVSVGARQFLHYMSVNYWPPNRPWLTNHAGLAYSDDRGRTWTRSPTAVWPNDSHNRNGFQMGAFVKHGGHVYLFGTPAGRQGPVRLARVPQNKVLDKAAYAYWNGTSFRAGDEAGAQPIVPGPVSELSVAYNRRFKRWLMVYLAPQRDALVLRDAPALTGPWTGEKILIRGAKHPSLYGGYIHPWFNDGTDLYFTMSEWGPYNVFWMRARLAPAHAANLLTDGGFEEDAPGESIGAPWRLEGGGGRDRNKGLAHTGKNNAFLRGNVSGLSTVSQTVAVSPGGNYRLSAWVRTSADLRDGYLGVRTPDGRVLRETKFARLDPYTKVTLDIAAGSHALLEIFVGLRVRNNQDTWVQTDDLSLVPR